MKGVRSRQRHSIENVYELLFSRFMKIPLPKIFAGSKLFFREISHCSAAGKIRAKNS